MRNGTLDAPPRDGWFPAGWRTGWSTGWWTARWRQALAATLILMAGLIFAAVAWTTGTPLPSWTWLALVAVASLAVATQPHEAEAGAAFSAPAPGLTGLAAEPRAASPAVHTMLAAASHEFRTPLNAIIGFSELLRDSAGNGADLRQRTEYANAVIENARSLEQKLGNVLDANRISANALTLSEQHCDMAEIIEAVCRDCQAAAAARGVTIVARIAEGISCHADLHRLRQALTGIVDNAIAFSPGDGIVNINMLRGTDAGLVVSVSDAGTGIAEKDMARAFEPFRQIDEGMTRHHGGLGLGLYIARGILRLHGGDVALTSSPQSGTEVRLHLPASRVDWKAASADAANAPVAHVA